VPIRRLIDFAGTCVFTKQSLGPILCGLLPLRTARALRVPEAPLLPKLRGHFAEFLLHGSLEHLRLLASPTCVGLRYGRTVHSRPRLFLAAGLENPWQGASSSRSASGLTSRTVVSPRSRLPRCTGTSNPRRLFCFRVPPDDPHTRSGTGILTRFPSPTPLGLGLGAG
jgi:hypothetical protein